MKSFVLIERDERFLLIREASWKWRGQWFLPGGGVREGEAPEAAARREAMEEAGCVADIEGIIYLRCCPRLFGSRLQIYYKGSTDAQVLKTSSDHHSMEARWLSYPELEQLPLRGNLLDIIDAYRYQKQGLPVDRFRVLI